MTDAMSPPRKKLKATPTQLDTVTCLEELLKQQLPSKESCHQDWLKALKDPSVCITTLDDVKRLGVEDIPSLPVPPLVKGVFRQVIKREEEKGKEQHAVLEATAARAKAFLAPLRDRNMQPPPAGSKYFQDQKAYRLILTSEEIQAGVRIVAHRLETWCKGERIVLVGILKGAFMFMSDLCRVMTRPYSVYFIEASSYKEGRDQGAMSISGEAADKVNTKFVDATTRRPHKIVLVDELLDNGKTMHDVKAYFLDMLKGTHTENDVLTACLFDKDRPREYPGCDIVGIPKLPDLWVVGYGLDDRGTKRGWTELFAVPKVKIVATIELNEVTKLLEVIDDNAMLTAHHVFGGFELPWNHKQRYRVSGLDINGKHLKLGDQEIQIKYKADIQRALEHVQVIRGRYEHEVMFAFSPENQHLIPEDAIFYGNNQVYAKMRCSLRKAIDVAAQRCGVAGTGSIA